MKSHTRKNRRFWDGDAAAYQRRHARQLNRFDEPRWGVWGIPESAVGEDIGASTIILRDLEYTGVTVVIDEYGSLLGVVIGVVFARIAAEFILIVFRINEHLGAIRNRGEM